MTEPKKLTLDRIANIIAELRSGCFSLAPGASGTISALLGHIAALEHERDEARRAAGLGCDAAAGAAHTVIRQGEYSFCGACGETIISPDIRERARKAEADLAAAIARAEAAEAERDAAVNGRRDFRQAFRDTRARVKLMEEAIKAADVAINPHDLGGISLAEWNGRLNLATKQIRAALSPPATEDAADA